MIEGFHEDIRLHWSVKVLIGGLVSGIFLRGWADDLQTARAALFPSITLTGSVGSGSRELDALFGSGNWDDRSMRLNFEFNVEAYDRQLAGGLDARIRDTISRSRPRTLALMLTGWSSRRTTEATWWKRPCVRRTSPCQ